MMRKMPRNREIHTKPGSRERLISVKFMIPRYAADDMKELERSRRYTKEEIFLAGIRTCMEQGA